MRQRLGLNTDVDILSRDEYLSGVAGIVSGLLALRQPPEMMWWPFQLTADAAGNLGPGVSLTNPGNGTIYQVPEGMSITMHFLSYTVSGVTPANPVTTANEWTEVVIDGIQNQPGVWFTPSGPGGWVVPTQQRWGSHGPRVHESQRVSLCGTLGAGAVVVGRLMFELSNRPHVMSTRLVGARPAVPAPRPPGTGIPGGPVGPSILGNGHVTAGQRTPGGAG